MHNVQRRLATTRSTHHREVKPPGLNGSRFSNILLAKCSFRIHRTTASNHVSAYITHNPHFIVIALFYESTDNVLTVLVIVHSALETKSVSYQLYVIVFGSRVKIYITI